MTKTVHQLKVTIVDTKPPVWRRVLVPTEITLGALHDVLQAAFGWWNCHLHGFEIDGIRYGIDDGESWEPAEDERRTRLGDVAGEGAAFAYTYDFGDNWRHKIAVEKVVPADPGATYPTCTAGRRACPPEDCGGAYGYRDLLGVIADPDDEEHDSMIEWLGGGFDPDAFNPGDFDARLEAVRLTAF